MRKFFDALTQYARTIRLIAPLIWKASPRLFLIVFSLTFLTGLLPVASIVINADLLDLLVNAVKHPQDIAAHITQLILLLTALGGSTLLGQVLALLHQTVQQLYQTRLTNYIQLLIAEKATAIDLASFEDTTFHNQMRNAVGEAAYRPMSIIQSSTGLVSILTTFTTVVGIILLWHWWIVPVIFVSSLAQLWVSTHFGKAHVALVTGRAETEREKQYINSLLSAEAGAREIRLFGLRSFLLKRFRSLLETTYQQDKNLSLRQLRVTSLVELLLAAVQPLMIGFTALQALQLFISISQFSLYTQSILQLESCTLGLTGTLGGLYENYLFVSYLFRFLALEPVVEAPRPRSQEYAARLSALPGIELRHVSFRYPGTERWILHDVSCIVRPGEVIALVGENGAGKTTLVKLLTGLYEPTEGQILLDGVNISHLNRDVLRGSMSIILQDYIIYQFSIADNIGVGQIGSIEDRGRIEAAGRRSGLQRIVDTLPNGYDTKLGRSWQGGHEFSGGQKQLTALARALMRQAPILILDEPSAALDIYTEQSFFQQLLDQQDQKQTVIFISHRFTTVRRADHILVLEHGRLIEQGSHDALMARNERYAEMFTMQAKHYSEAKEESTGKQRKISPIPRLHNKNAIHDIPKIPMERKLKANRLQKLLSYQYNDTYATAPLVHLTHALPGLPQAREAQISGPLLRFHRESIQEIYFQISHGDDDRNKETCVSQCEEGKHGEEFYDI